MLRNVWTGMLKEYQRDASKDNIHSGVFTNFYPHVVYGGAHRFSENTIPKLEKMALLVWRQFSSKKIEFAKKILPPRIAPTTEQNLEIWLQSIDNQLQKQSIFDFRIDFEDGFGYKTKEVYLSEAARVGGLLATMPVVQARVGIRILPFQKKSTSLSLEILTALLESFFQSSESGKLPPHFVITLPKVKHIAEIRLLADLLAEFELLHGQKIETELMLETPEAWLADIPAWLEAAGDRCTGLHLGVYDLLSSLNIPAVFQELTHEVCQSLLLKSLAATYDKDIQVSTGAALHLAIPSHTSPKNHTQELENQEYIENTWRSLATYHLEALRMGIFQGWDLHPNQIPIRIAVYHAFFQKTFSESIFRLQHFENQGQTAIRSGQQFDDLASIRGILNTFERGRLCGAFSTEQLAQIDAIKINTSF